MGLRNLSITLLYELFFLQGLNYFPCFLYKKLETFNESINEHFDNFVNLPDCEVVFILS